MDRQFLTVPVQRVHPDPLNARQTIDQKALQHLADSLRAQGQLVPGIACPHPAIKGDYMAVDCHRRLLALPMAGKLTIDLVVLSEKPDAADLLVLQTSLGVTNEKLSPADLADACQRLEELRPDWTRAAIAKAIGISPAQLSKCMTISESLAPGLKPLVESGAIPFSVAAMLARLPSADDQSELAKKVVDGLLKRESVEDAVKAKLGKKVKAAPKSVKLRVGNLMIEFVGEKVEQLTAAWVAFSEMVKRSGAKPTDPLELLPVLLKRNQ